MSRVSVLDLIHNSQADFNTNRFVLNYGLNYEHNYTFLYPRDHYDRNPPDCDGEH